MLFFGGSIFIHEFGHFLAAKWRGLKVLRFSIGFGPKLFSWRGKDGCKYMISLLPLGGYVALPQLADMGALEGEESSDAESLKKLPKASALDKIIVSAAGAFFNVLLAVVLAAIVWIIGMPEPQTYSTNVIGFVPEVISDASNIDMPSPAFKAGLKSGDKILSIDGTNVDNFMQIIEHIAIGSGRDSQGNPSVNLKIERDGKIFETVVNPTLVKTNTATDDKIRMIGISPSMIMKVGSVMKDSPAQIAGIKEGDIVSEIDGVKLFSNQQLVKKIGSLKEDKSVELTVIRDDKPIKILITPQAIEITKQLCVVEFPKKDGTISFIESGNSKDNSTCVKIFEIKTNTPEVNGVSAGAILYKINDKEISTLSQLNAIVNTASTHSHIKLSFMSNGELKDIFLPTLCMSKILPPRTQVMMGYMLENVMLIKHPNIIYQFKDSISRTYNAISSLINPHSDIGISSLAGPVDIGRVIYKLSLSDFSLVLSFAVLLNINLAILNMMPIPVLDGGHILFAIIEKLRGKPLSPTVFATIQGAFSILFMSLMIYIVYIGFARWKGDADMEEADKVQSEYYIKNISFKNHE